VNLTQDDFKAVLRISRVYHATREEVFSAWIDPEQVKVWMCAGKSTVARVEIDLRIGGAFRIDMQDEAGYFVHTGIYVDIQPSEKLAFTWTSENTKGKETLVTVELFERGEQTELVLTQELLPDQETFEAHKYGWTSILEKLERQLANRLSK
jgi:uncharacterized protein YndB with AHSA1/START domain